MTNPQTPVALHLVASMCVVASNVRMRYRPRRSRAATVLEAARRIAEGVTPEMDMLRLRLGKVTGVPIAELARHARNWPQS